MENVMIDIETMGVESNAAIVAIGAARFGLEHQGITDTFSVNVSLENCLHLGFTTSAKTILWWMDHASEAVWRNSPVNLTEALLDLTTFICGGEDKAPLIWSKGPGFDLVILSNAYSALGLSVPWSFRDTRCVRTMNWLSPKAIEDLENPQKHTAIVDAIHQARCVRKSWENLTK